MNIATSPAKTRLSSFLVEDKYRLFRHALLQLMLLIISLGNFFDAPDQLNLSSNRVYGGIGYFIFLNVLVYFNMYVLFPAYMAKNQIGRYAVAALVFVGVMGGVMVVLQANFYDIGVIHQDPSPIAVLLSITSSVLAMLLFIGGVAGLLSFKQWLTDKRRLATLKTATYAAELKYLKSQINPHFLFNMLNNAHILLEDDPRTATDILVNLNELLQYQLSGSLHEKVRLQDDICFLTHYLELEKTRRERFGYTLSIAGEVDKVEIAPLLFIPFVENAVKHNVAHSDGSFIAISFDRTQNGLTFTCRNTAAENKIAVEDGGGLGLTNVRRRLDLLFGERYVLQQTRSDSFYTVKLQLEL